MTITIENINIIKEILPKFNGILEEWEVELSNPYIVCKNKFLHKNKIFDITFHISPQFFSNSNIEIYNNEEKIIFKFNSDKYDIDMSYQYYNIYLKIINMFIIFSNNIYCLMYIENEKIVLNTSNPIINIMWIKNRFMNEWI